MVVVRGARSVGLKVPEVLLVIGYSNLHPAELSNTRQINIAEPFFEIFCGFRFKGF